MAVTLINVFIVPADRQDEFLSSWKETAAFFQSSKQSGFIETHLHKNTGTGNQTFAFVNIARWESAEHWQRSHDAYKPKEYLIPGVKGHPAIFECVVDLYGEGKTDARDSILTVPRRAA